MSKKLTNNQKRILEIFDNNNEKSFVAYEIADRLSTDMHLATVYRNLEKLVEDGRLIKFKSGKDDQYRYQATQPDNHCHQHLHMRCSKCNNIFHLECDFMHELEGHLMEHHGFKIQCDNSIIEGICAKCGGKA